MRQHRWFLPETPDVVGLLGHQCAITVEGLAAFEAWAAGDAGAADAVADAEDRSERAKRDTLGALRAAFFTPLEPEDLFALAQGIDRVLSSARDVVVESGVLACPPDGGIAQMAAVLCRAMRLVTEAIGQLGPRGSAATASADAAIAALKDLDEIYYRAMASLLAVDERSNRIAGRELYRRCAHTGDVVAETAERIVYAVLKQT